MKALKNKRRVARPVLLLMTLVGMTVGLGGCERGALDRQMEELCKKDGGIRVYETVTLPASDFNQFGEPLGRYIQTMKSEEDRFGPDYRYVSKREVLVGKDANPERGEGRLVRVYTAIYRRSDNKLLGEQIWYQRGGGDGFTFGFQPSGKNCPVFGGASVGLQVFRKGS